MLARIFNHEQSPQRIRIGLTERQRRRHAASSSFNFFGTPEDAIIVLKTDMVNFLTFVHVELEGIFLVVGPLSAKVSSGLTFTIDFTLKDS